MEKEKEKETQVTQEANENRINDTGDNTPESNEFEYSIDLGDININSHEYDDCIINDSITQLINQQRMINRLLCRRQLRKYCRYTKPPRSKEIY